VPTLIKNEKRMSPNLSLQFVAFVLILSIASQSAATQATPQETVHPAKDPWTFSLITDGYIVADDVSYANPNFLADHGWLHLEARYNYENLRTGSLWVGYNFSAGKKVVFNATPMIGGVFGRTNGIAPGCAASLTYKKLQLSISNEYVFDTGDRSQNFYYDWPQLTYSPVDWLQVGLVAQRTKAYQTSLDTQRGFFVGLSHKNKTLTSYIFNVGWTTPTVVLELGLDI